MTTPENPESVSPERVCRSRGNPSLPCSHLSRLWRRVECWSEQRDLALHLRAGQSGAALSISVSGEGIQPGRWTG